MSRALSPSPTAQHPAPPLVPRTLGVGLILVVMIVAFEAMAVGTVMPRVASDLNGLALFGWASSAFLLSSLFGAVASGTLADRCGLAPGTVVSLALFALGLLVGGTAASMPAFVLGRVIQGLGAGGLGALPWAVITTRYPEASRPRMLAAMSSAWLLPVLVGPLIASVIADQWSWRPVFWGLVPLLLLAAPLCVLPLLARHGGAGAERSGPPAPKRQLWPALGLLASAGALIEGLRRPDPLALAVAGVGLVGLLVAARPLFPVGMGRLAPGLPRLLALRGLLAFAFMGSGTFLPLALHDLRGLSLSGAGVVLSVGGVTWTAGSWLQARIERRWNGAYRTLTTRAAMVCVVLGLGLTALTTLGALPLWCVYAGQVLGSLGMGIGYNGISLNALASVPAAEAGRSSGQLANIETLMVALAAGIGGALIARVEPLQGAFTLAFGVALLAALIAVVAALRLRLSAAG
ncbi:MFS family permease [Deinococcus metalli]|uniref:MFS family permease n=1 Tax=Deinococcus metalli TaxID=1141878 RepID=A0A7W8NPE8_9DEIO|nr:MFS transporter [Deinococcus metalli]MBB5376716.1 MFS family permease [Deinococcus metalli]GHF44807.1 MFS transporter [Deinococcus metalli]